MERQHELGSLLLGIELPPNAAIAEGGSTTREALIVASFAKAQIGLDDQGLPIELFLSNSEHGYISVTVVDDKVYVSYESMV